MSKKCKNVDPFMLEVINNGICNVSREMNIVMAKTAYSTIFSEAHDYSCTIFDKEGKMVAQAEATPIHMASMPFAIQACLKKFKNDLKPGDLIIHNDPFNGGCHLNDVTALSPVFSEDGELVFIVANRAHELDLGGMSAGGFCPQASEMFQEGMCYPPVKLYDGGMSQQGIWDLILANTRYPYLLKGDLMAQISACRRGEERLKEMLKKYGRECIEDMIAAMYDQTERRIRSGIEKIPDGIYSYTDYVDDDGVNLDKPLKIHVTITIKGSNCKIDFTGTDLQGQGAFNTVYPVTFGAAYVEILSLTDRTIPMNEGAYRPVEIIVPLGTHLNATNKCATMFGNGEMSGRVGEIIRICLASVTKDITAAAHVGTTRQCVGFGEKTPGGEKYIWYQFPGGGMGGWNGQDGSSALMAEMSNCRNTPIEVFETQFPWRIHRMELRQDSGGPGKYRGGLGILKDYELLADEARISNILERTKFPPTALFGGERGRAGVFSYFRNGKETILPPKVTGAKLIKGDILRLQSPGGGGFMPASERDINKIKEDVKKGYVSKEGAFRDYGLKL